MRVAIVTFEYIPFFIKLAKYLEKENHEVIFLNPNYKIRNLLLLNSLKYIKYVRFGKKANINKLDFKRVIFLKKYLKYLSSKTILKLLNKKYRIAYENLYNAGIDRILIFNGVANIESLVAKDLNIKSFFFENGYFDDTIQLNLTGVNYGALITNYRFRKKHIRNNREIYIKNLSFIKSVVLDAMDPWFVYFIFLRLKNKFNLLIHKDFSKSPSHLVNLNEDYIFFPLQVNLDTQVILNSRFNDFYECLDEILPKLKKLPYKIILKEHPKEKEFWNYSKYIDGRKVFLVKDYDINKLIENCKFVVTINSSVGMQAISKYKPVLILGKTFYEGSPLSINYYERMDFKEIKDKINKVKINKKKVDRYIKFFKEDFFIKGSFENPNVEMFEKIYQRILNN